MPFSLNVDWNYFLPFVITATCIIWAWFGDITFTNLPEVIFGMTIEQLLMVNIRIFSIIYVIATAIAWNIISMNDTKY